MDFIAEVVSATTFFVTKPLSLAIQSGISVVRSVTQTWMDLSMDMRLQDIQIEIEDLIQNKRKLDQRLQLIVNHYKYIQEMYAELEDEHDVAVCKLELLQGELENLKIENQRLKETQDKAIWQNTQKWEDDKTSPKDIRKSISDATDLTETGTGPSDERHILELKRRIAVSQSGFSLLMSLSVGMVVLQAKDQCMPLLLALLVSTMLSLKNVLKYFLTIKNKPANQAVVLLGLNCFMLGALTCPMLPTIGRLLSPLIFSVTGGIK